MKWFRRATAPSDPPPEFIAKYQRAVRTKSNPTQPIQQIRFVVYDTETTGLNPKKDHWLSLGAIVVQHQTIWIEQSLEYILLRNEVNVSDQIGLHGITQQSLTHGTNEREVLQQWLSFIEGSVLVAHHIAFDEQIINRALQRNYADYGVRLQNATLDTGLLAQRLDRFNTMPGTLNPAHYSLDALCHRYNIPPNDRHTAAGDAFLTAQLLLKLLALAEQRGLKTYRQLIR